MLGKAIVVGLGVASLSSYSTNTYAQSWVTEVNDACAAAEGEYREPEPQFKLLGIASWLARIEYRNSNRMTNAVQRLEQITVPPNSVSDVRRLIDDLNQCVNVSRKVADTYANGGGLDQCDADMRDIVVLPDLQQVANKLGVPDCLNVALVNRTPSWDEAREAYAKNTISRDVRCGMKISRAKQYSSLEAGIKVVVAGLESCFRPPNATADAEKGIVTLALTAQSSCTGNVFAFVNGNKVSVSDYCRHCSLTSNSCRACPFITVIDTDWKGGNSAFFSVTIENFDPKEGYEVEFDFLSHKTNTPLYEKLP